jgi:hypothetical protein
MGEACGPLCTEHYHTRRRKDLPANFKQDRRLLTERSHLFVVSRVSFLTPPCASASVFDSSASVFGTPCCVCSDWLFRDRSSKTSCGQVVTHDATQIGFLAPSCLNRLVDLVGEYNKFLGFHEMADGKLLRRPSSAVFMYVC